MKYGKQSQIGLLGTKNEDSCLIADEAPRRGDKRSSGIIFTVADGLGGHLAGEIASQMACEWVVSEYYKDESPFTQEGDKGETRIFRLERIVWMAHRLILSRSREEEGLRGMGTTLSALVLRDHEALIAHVGDSRIYRLRDGLCQRMTVDHTGSQFLLDAGRLPPEGENGDPCGRIVTQALGGYDNLSQVFTRTEELRQDDIMLLCTDGLHDYLTDQDICRILQENDSPQRACDELVRTALTKGGQDDITAIVIHA